MSTIKSHYNAFMARKRWVKKYLPFLVPNLDSIKISPKLTMFYSLKDVAGPSYDFGYDRKKAFENYEAKDKELLKNYLDKDSVFFDVGANIGHFSFYFKELYPEMVCHLFEPNPKLTDCINKTLSHSSHKDISLHKVALSNKSGSATFFLDDYNDGGHSLIADRISPKSKRQEQLEVTTISLDDFFPTLCLSRLDVIKVDIQGAEYAFIEGARDTLKKYRPVMLIEIDSDEPFEFVDFLEKQVEAKFDIYTSDSLGPIKKEDLKELGHQNYLQGKKESNFLFVPKKA